MDASKPGIVWVTLDSVRADHTTIHDYERNTTPELERIADHGQSFTNCFAHGTGTASSVASIFTGVWPWEHQVAMNGSVGEIPDQLRTAAEIFREQGYRTACVTTNPRIDLIGGDAGFDEYYDISRSTLLNPEFLPITLRFLKNFWSESVGLTWKGVHHSFSYIVTEIARRWVESVNEPYFLYVHYNEPHRPYYPPLSSRDRYTTEVDVTEDRALHTSTEIHERSREYNAGELEMTRDDWEAVEAMYDAEIAYTDSYVGSLFDYVESSNPVFVVTADHGELLGEGSMFGHGQGVVRDELSHVPLVLSGVPDLAVDEDEIVQHIDVMRTLLSMAGASDDQFGGFDLCNGQTRGFAVIQEYTENFAAFEKHTQEFNSGPRKLGRIDGLRTDEFKLVVSQDDVVLYELPDEDTDVSPTRSNVRERLLEQHEAFNKEHGQPLVDSPTTDDYDERMKKRLSDLGYIQ